MAQTGLTNEEVAKACQQPDEATKVFNITVQYLISCQYSPEQYRVVDVHIHSSTLCLSTSPKKIIFIHIL